MNINWTGLWTIIRREMSRLMRVPIQAFVGNRPKPATRMPHVSDHRSGRASEGAIVPWLRVI